MSARGTRLARLHRVYYLHAVFNVSTVASSLIVGHQLLEIVDSAMKAMTALAGQIFASIRSGNREAALGHMAAMDGHHAELTDALHLLHAAGRAAGRRGRMSGNARVLLVDRCVSSRYRSITW
jgi:hypothetical protein